MNTCCQPRALDRLPLAGASAERLLTAPESAFRRIVGAISRLRQRRPTMRALDALNDHQLKDIGLDRSDIVSPRDETNRFVQGWP